MDASIILNIVNFQISFSITFAFDFYIKSVKTFEFCREFMYLSILRRLERVSSFFKPSASFEIENKIYLEEQVKKLKRIRKICRIKT